MIHAMPTPLQTFIAHARSKNMDHQTIRMLLLSAGWKEKDIAAALVSGTLDMQVPVPVDTGSAKDAFFHLLTFTTLYSTVISLIVLAFEYIGRWFPDPAVTSYAYGESADVSTIRWAIAVIIVSFPMFILLSRALHREFATQPEKLALGVRKWLTYLTLFVTACTLIGDVITLLFHLLNGELTMRFLLKVIAVLVLSGLPFLYYFSVLRMDTATYAKSGLHQIFQWIAVVLTLLFVGYGVWLAGSPMQGRAEKFDEQRVSDLRAIQSEMYTQLYGQMRFPPEPVTVLPKPLPADLSSVAAAATYQKLRLADPETSQPYEYRPENNTFELCATFATVKDQSYNIFWNHSAGRHCFVFNALERGGK